MTTRERCKACDGRGLIVDRSRSGGYWFEPYACDRCRDPNGRPTGLEPIYDDFPDVTE